MPAQVHGTRNAGTINIPSPVAIPKGGMIIFLAVTAVRDSRTRQIITAIAPATEVISDITLRKGIVMNSSSKASVQIHSKGLEDAAHGLPRSSHSMAGQAKGNAVY